MKNLLVATEQKHKDHKQIIWSLLVIAGVVIGGVLIFISLYSAFIDETLYAERLSQMREVTTQLFAGLEDVVNNQWRTTSEQCRALQLDKPRTMDEFLDFMKDQAYLGDFDAIQSNVVAVDEKGRYYTQEGQQGFLTERDYLRTLPDRVSFVSNSMILDETRMVFLQRLDEPMIIRNGNLKITIRYFGIAQNMEKLNPYFNCTAYNGNNSVYVVDSEGLKLFSSSGDDIIKGFNVYHVLNNLDYLHGSTFSLTRQELEENKIAYSNALLNGTEIYYALYQMDNAEWTLLFLVPSEYVAINTVRLVNMTIRLVLIFAGVVLVVCVFAIIMLMRSQQKMALEIERTNNERLEKVNKELSNAVELAKRATQEAENANKAKSEFLSNMSHDIRTPMNAIVGIASLMEHDKGNPDKLDTYIHKIQKSSQHLLGLINDVLDMSKIESSDVSLNNESISLAEQIGQVDSIIRPQAEERGQKFVIRVHEIRHEYLIGDAVRLRQIFINLLSNAVKYTPYGGAVQLDLKEVPCTYEGYATIQITVTDTGYGMSPEFVTRVFEPFTRAENSTTNKVQGTGLGMAITKSIVDLMGGSINVQSEPDKGTVFDIILTLAIDQGAEPEINARSVLLISEENALIKNMSAALLETSIDFHVAATEAEAMMLVDRKKMDVIILAGHLQDRTLPDTVKLLRGSAKDAVLIFCCDYVRQEQVRNILVNSGIDGLIARPFFLSNFINAVNQVHDDTVLTQKEDVFSLGGMRFLCAEDNALNAEILEAILDMNHASCKIYSDGAELVKAFADVKSGEYDAILMDVQMPKMNGLEATRAIRKGSNPLGKEIPIIAMTANAFSSDVQDCLNAGMDAHVSKPLQISMLERALRSVMNSSTRGEGHVSAIKRHE